MVSGTHTIPISLGILMGVGLGNSMGPAYHKGVPCPWGSLKIPLKCVIFRKLLSLRIQVCPIRKRLSLHSYSKDRVGTLIPILGRGLDS